MQTSVSSSALINDATTRIYRGRHSDTSLARQRQTSSSIAENDSEEMVGSLAKRLRDAVVDCNVPTSFDEGMETDDPSEQSSVHIQRHSSGFSDTIVAHGTSEGGLTMADIESQKIVR